jgi:two-component system, sensor histidine kinase
LDDDFHASSVAMIHEGLEHLDQGFSIFDQDFRLAAFNRPFLELLDFPDEMGRLGRPLADFFRFNAARGDYGPGDVDDLVAERMALAAKAQPHCFERVRPNGTVIEVRGQPLPCGGFVTTYTDITERKRWEDDLEAAKSAAEHANLAKSDFLNMVSHELRTPLTAIRSFSEILCDHPDVEPEQRLDFLRVINKECQRLIRMINDLLDFAKIEAGRMDWSITELDPKSLVESAAASVASMFEEKQVDLVLALPPQAPPVNADADRLTQVVVNLLSNAHKFAPGDTGRVQVGLDSGTTELTISVIDNGPGIPPDQHEEIFEEFHQGVCEDGTHPSGTGLGLAICQRIVDRLGGRIWVESTPGHGATFRFTLPVGGDALLSDS